MNERRLFLFIILIFGLISTAGCAGKYLVKSYPAGAKVYIRDLQTKEKRLVGLSPVQINEDSRLGDVFFLVYEKQNYKPKDVMVRVNEGESLTVAAQLDPLSPEEMAEAEKTAANDKKDDQKPQTQPPQDKKKKGIDEKVDDLELRMALVENTLDFYKEAMFSSRFNGNGQAKFDRDRNDKVVESMFTAQKAIMAGNYPVASKAIDEAIAQDEYLARAWLLKGSLNYLQKDYEGARRAWERTLKIDPYEKTAYAYLSKVYQILGLGELPKQPSSMRYPSSQVEIEKKAKK